MTTLSNNPIGDRGIIIKNWKFDERQNRKYAAQGVYINLPADGSSRPRWKWSYSEAWESNGIKGQGNSDPPSWFDVHKVVRIGNHLYDPSYGLKHTGATWEESLKLFQMQTVAGFWRNGQYAFPQCNVFGYGIMKSENKPEQELSHGKDTK